MAVPFFVRASMHPASDPCHFDSVGGSSYSISVSVGQAPVITWTPPMDKSATLLIVPSATYDAGPPYITGVTKYPLDANTVNQGSTTVGQISTAGDYLVVMYIDGCTYSDSDDAGSAILTVTPAAQPTVACVLTITPNLIAPSAAPDNPSDDPRMQLNAYSSDSGTVNFQLTLAPEEAIPPGGVYVNFDVAPTTTDGLSQQVVNALPPLGGNQLGTGISTSFVFNPARMLQSPTLVTMQVTSHNAPPGASPLLITATAYNLASPPCPPQLSAATKMVVVVNGNVHSFITANTTVSPPPNGTTMGEDCALTITPTAISPSVTSSPPNVDPRLDLDRGFGVVSFDVDYDSHTLPSDGTLDVTMGWQPSSLDGLPSNIVDGLPPVGDVAGQFGKGITTVFPDISLRQGWRSDSFVLFFGTKNLPVGTYPILFTVTANTPVPPCRSPVTVATTRIIAVVGMNSTTPSTQPPSSSQPDFSFTLSQSSISVNASSTSTTNMIVTPSNGFNSPVTLSTTWLGNAPVGVEVSTAPSVTPPSSTPITITAQAGAVGGDYTLQVTGTGGSITHTASLLVHVTGYPAPKCIIATAAYGSELAAPVQFLRSFRDNEVQKTALGSAFLTAFNGWYYSWAPGIAQRIALNENYKATTRAIIAPLIGSLFVGHALFSVLVPLSPGLAIVSAGLLSSALIGLAYLTPIYALMWKLSKRKIMRRTIYGLAVAAAAMTFFATLTTGTFNVAANLTALTVVETLLLTPALAMRRISRFR